VIYQVHGGSGAELNPLLDSLEGLYEAFESLVDHEDVVVGDVASVLDVAQERFSQALNFLSQVSRRTADWINPSHGDLPPWVDTVATSAYDSAEDFVLSVSSIRGTLAVLPGCDAMVVQGLHENLGATWSDLKLKFSSSCVELSELGTRIRNGEASDLEELQGTLRSGQGIAQELTYEMLTSASLMETLEESGNVARTAVAKAGSASHGEIEAIVGQFLHGEEAVRQMEAFSYGLKQLESIGVDAKLGKEASDVILTPTLTLNHNIYPE